ncbi:Fc.00g114030.m01.CDS01 [Cosmosporella sp. VM-42]
MSSGPGTDEDNGHKKGKVKKIVAKIRGHSGSKDGSEKPKCFHLHHHKHRQASDQEKTAQISLELWNSAYDFLKNDSGSAGLVLAYEAIIIQELPKDQKLALSEIPSEKRLEFMHAIALSGLRKGLSSKSSDVDDSAREIIMYARENVESLLDSCPSAAVAWAGICILTPLLLDPLLRQQDMKDGLIYLTNNISRFTALSRTLLQENWETADTVMNLRDHTRHTLLNLYRKILEFEMNCICAGASSWNIAAKNVVDWNGWSSMAAAVRDADEQLERDIEKYGTKDARERFRRDSGDETIPVKD